MLINETSKEIEQKFLINMTTNIFTIDVEEYYHTENVSSSLSEEKISSLSCRVEKGCYKLLELLEKYKSRATFFILGCIAEKNRELIKEISTSGHEIASHGYNHIPLNKHTPQTFDEGLRKSIDLLSDITGQKVTGYRAPNFSFTRERAWYFDILKKNCIIYDSSFSYSLFRNCSHELDEVLEFYNKVDIILIPISFLKISSIKLPLGGGYFRAMPYSLTKWGLNSAAQNKNLPVVFYIHPWELDPEQPKFSMTPMRHYRHYNNLNNTEKKLEQLLTDMKFVSIKEYLNGTQGKLEL